MAPESPPMAACARCGAADIPPSDPLCPGCRWTARLRVDPTLGPLLVTTGPGVLAVPAILARFAPPPEGVDPAAVAARWPLPFPALQGERPMPKPLVIYHADCPDGFAAAFAAWLKLGDGAEYIPAKYGDPIPAAAETAPDVFILDFSWPRDPLVALAGRRDALFGTPDATFVVLDHHRTAQADLDGLAFATFDMEKSGAVLAWEYFHLGEPVPRLISYVQDRDLWRWELPGSREVNAYLGTFERDFGTWHHLMRALDTIDGLETARDRGQFILHHIRRVVAGLCANYGWTRIFSEEIPTVNSATYQSEVGEELCRRSPDSPYAAVYAIDARGDAVVSLRSRGGYDVSAVARSFGGGGHAAAAGFKMPAHRFIRQEVC